MSLPTTLESDNLPSRFMTSYSPVFVTARRLMDPATSNTDLLHYAVTVP